MARQKYKQKPLFWNCIQYDGSNAAEIVAFCNQCSVSDGQLLFMGMIVEPTNWILEDNAGRFSMQINSQFQVFFQLEPGP
jgi:hypothetical protein